MERRRDAATLRRACCRLPPDDRYRPLLQLTPERQKELTLNALLDAVPAAWREAARWCSRSRTCTGPIRRRSSCSGACRRTAQASDVDGPGEAPRLCVVFTARPQFAPPWPIGELSLMPLPHLASAEVEEMVQASLAPIHRRFPRKVIDEVILRSDGIPLFIEEVTRVLAESATGERRARRPWPEIPGSLRDLLTARLDGVSGSAKETAQLAVGARARIPLRGAARGLAQARIAGARRPARAGQRAA